MAKSPQSVGSDCVQQGPNSRRDTSPPNMHFRTVVAANRLVWRVASPAANMRNDRRNPDGHQLSRSPQRTEVNGWECQLIVSTNDGAGGLRQLTALGEPQLCLAECLFGLMHFFSGNGPDVEERLGLLQLLLAG